MHPTLFIHGLDSSSQGTKARYFKKRFPKMIIPDFSGSFTARMTSFQEISTDISKFILIGSSFGGLMATVFTMQKPEKVLRLILLAPALNFPDFDHYPVSKISAPTLICIGKNDTVTPLEKVLPKAESIFTNIEKLVVDDDHLLRKSFTAIDWFSLLV